MLIVDEVQSGMRTNRQDVRERSSRLKADIITIAKGIGSGLPIGATVRTRRFDGLEAGAHASTFGGNPVCIAAALKTIELLENGLVRNSAEVGAYLKAGLETLMAKYDCVGDVRGMGLMIGVEFVKDKASKTEDPELRERVETGMLRAWFDRSRLRRERDSLVTTADSYERECRRRARDF